MHKCLITSIILVFLITACKPSVTGSTVVNIEEKELQAEKTLVDEEELIPPSVKPDTTSCEKEAKDLRDKIYEESYNMVQVGDEVKKIAMEIQYYKEKDQKKYNALEKKMDALSQEKKEKKENVEDMKAAFKILVEKCNLNLKLKRA